jgi:hypothetical protein
MAATRWSWLGRLLLPEEPCPTPDAAAAQQTEQALEDAKRATREFEQLRRRARALGLDVDLARPWRPREDEHREGRW